MSNSLYGTSHKRSRSQLFSTSSATSSISHSPLDDEADQEAEYASYILRESIGRTREGLRSGGDAGSSLRTPISATFSSSRLSHDGTTPLDDASMQAIAVDDKPLASSYSTPNLSNDIYVAPPPSSLYIPTRMTRSVTLPEAFANATRQTSTPSLILTHPSHVYGVTAYGEGGEGSTGMVASDSGYGELPYDGFEQQIGMGTGVQDLMESGRYLKSEGGMEYSVPRVGSTYDHQLGAYGDQMDYSASPTVNYGPPHFADPSPRLRSVPRSQPSRHISLPESDNEHRMKRSRSDNSLALTLSTPVPSYPHNDSLVPDTYLHHLGTVMRGTIGPQSEFEAAAEAAMIASQKTGAGAGAFVYKVYQMLLDETSQHLIAFSKSGTSFSVFNTIEFSREVLPKHFKHNNFSSFVRQLNMYGFHKVNKTLRGVTLRAAETQAWEFNHPKFVRGKPHQLELIKRKITDGDTTSPPTRVVNGSGSGSRTPIVSSSSSIRTPLLTSTSSTSSISARLRPDPQSLRSTSLPRHSPHTPLPILPSRRSPYPTPSLTPSHLPVLPYSPSPVPYSLQTRLEALETSSLLDQRSREVSREEYERLAWEFEVMRSRLNGLVNVVQALTGFVDTSPHVYESTQLASSHDTDYPLSDSSSYTFPSFTNTTYDPTAQSSSPPQYPTYEYERAEGEDEAAEGLVGLGLGEGEGEWRGEHEGQWE